MSSKTHGFSLKELREQAEDKANYLRGGYELGYKNVPNLFRFAEQTLDYFLIRYPFGKDKLEGLSAIYKGQKLIVTNSSHILPRERFTLAHEIAHHVFDLVDGHQSIISDNDTGRFNKQDPIEYRADCFAAAFLMPKMGVEKSIRELGIVKDNIGYFEIIQLQVEFEVSYRAMVRRLKDLDFINYEQAQGLRNYFEDTGEPLGALFKRINASTELLNPTEVVWIPTNYMNYLISNYENGHIPYSSLTKVLEVIDLTPEVLGLTPHSEPSVEEVDIEQLIQELENDV